MLFNSNFFHFGFDSLLHLQNDVGTWKESFNFSLVTAEMLIYTLLNHLPLLLLKF